VDSTAPATGFFTLTRSAAAQSQADDCRRRAESDRADSTGAPARCAYLRRGGDNTARDDPNVAVLGLRVAAFTPGRVLRSISRTPIPIPRLFLHTLQRTIRIPESTPAEFGRTSPADLVDAEQTVSRPPRVQRPRRPGRQFRPASLPHKPVPGFCDWPPLSRCLRRSSDVRRSWMNATSITLLVSPRGRCCPSPTRRFTSSEGGGHRRRSNYRPGIPRCQGADAIRRLMIHVHMK